MRRDEKGVALLTVLLLVAAMATIAVGVLDDLRFGIRRSANVRSAAQAQWYALGAEELARVQIARRIRLDPARTTLEGGWNGRPFRFAVEEGAIEASVSDASGCFNLNSVVEDRGGVYTRHDLGAGEFIALLVALGFDTAEAVRLQGALVDWIDTDNAVLAAEDGAYDAYRTAAAPLAEVSELRAVRGFTPQVYERIRAYVCALPVGLSEINVNTLPPERATLITALTGGRLAPQAAKRVLEGRPDGGWDHPAAFWQEPELVGVAPAGPAGDQAVVRTSYYALDADVEFAGSHVRLSSLFKAEGAGVRLIARRWTADE